MKKKTIIWHDRANASLQSVYTEVRKKNHLVLQAVNKEKG